MKCYRWIFAILALSASTLQLAGGGEVLGQSVSIASALTLRSSTAPRRTKNEVSMSDLQWGAPSEGLRLSASLDRGKVEAGYPVSLVLVLQNVSNRSVPVTSRSTWTDYRLTVRAHDGRQPDLTAFGKQVATTADLTRRTNVPLAPGEKLVCELLLNRLFDMSIADTYELRAERDIYRLGGEGSAVVTSNDVGLIVHEK